MKRLLFTLTAIFGFVILGFTQTVKLNGKILNKKNEPVVSATIQIAGSNTGTGSDVDGNFSLSLSVGKKYTLIISSVNYETKTISDVEAVNGQANELQVVLDESAKNTLSDVVVKATSSSARKETTASLIQFQKNTNTVASVISAEAIRRSPDKNTGDVLKRIPGASVQEGKYLVVRGLSDRYNQAMLNGILLSSTEPDRKTFSFDLFPSAVIDNIIMNKAFVPELPGEWAGGLVQVQTKEIPASDFLSVQIGTGFNSQTIGKNFYQAKGGKLDWLGIDDGTRALPTENFPVKSKFALLSPRELNEYGKQVRNVWTSTSGNAPLNTTFQLNGGFTGTLFKKKVGGTFGINYNQSNRRLQFDNAIIANNQGDHEVQFHNEKYSRDVLAGALANFSIQLNNNNRISFKNIININTSDFAIRRLGKDYILGPGYGDNVKAEEIGFRQNTFFNTQLIGDHNISKWGLRFKWYGGFNILDQYIPDQRRLFYTQEGSNPNAPYYALLAAGASQKSGSIFYSFLNDYIYNAGGDVTKSFKWLGHIQAIKGGYLFQVKDRLFDSRPFFLNTLSNSIKLLPPDQIFAPENFTNVSTGIQFGELNGISFRYIANTIMNAGYIQFDNQFTKSLRVIWGVRVEDFDQLIGSVKQSDPRHVHSKVTDFLPGMNITFKPNDKVNLRLSGSQTVVRPEFRELSPFAFYDFELNAQVVGNNKVRRTKITNADLRYEVYPRSGELITAGVFFKHFDDPIEYYFNRTGPATNTFNVSNTNVATALGGEFEFRKKLDFINDALKNFTVTGNLSYIYSRVKDTVALDRPLQGQSPYLINAGLQYDIEKIGFSSTVLLNQVGRRILFVGDKSVPDIWENPRALLDVQLAKKILKNKGEIKVNISDIFNRRAYFYHDLDNNEKYKSTSTDVLAISRNYGTNYSFTFAYTIK
ncbi:MAG TPA: outer membrane beta-barrel protein [Chitinophagaceae bacterium]|nr:outer membrane beta-barrel protein [Chitinophagaceae bacterium]